MNDTVPGTGTVPGTILAIDAAGHACSAALWRDGGVAVHETRVMSHGHAVELLPMIQRVMAGGGLDLRQCERLAVTVGPGGFTGLRIGLATARGLGLAIGCPVIGISSFQAAAMTALTAAPERSLSRLPAPCLVVLDSRRAEPYVALLDRDLAFQRPPALMTVADTLDLIRRRRIEIVLGDGLAALRPDLAGGTQIIDAAPDAVAAATLAADPQRRFDLPPDPVYLRPPDISQPKSQRQLPQDPSRPS